MSTALSAAILARLSNLSVKTCLIKFTSSGLFLPQEHGLQAGDVVRVQMIGGGASGATSGNYSRGGAAGYLIDQMTFIDDQTAPIQVVVGAGGIVGTGGNPLYTAAGGDSLFGSISAQGGRGGAFFGISAANTGGMGAGGANSSQIGGAPRNGWGRGGDAAIVLRLQRPNSGDGGDAISSDAQNGCAGFVQISWQKVVL